METVELADVFKSLALYAGLLAFNPSSARASPASVAHCHTSAMWTMMMMMMIVVSRPYSCHES